MSNFIDNLALIEDADDMQAERRRWAKVLARPDRIHGRRTPRRETPARPSRLYFAVLIAPLVAFAGAVLRLYF